MERTTSIREAFDGFLDDKDYQGVRPRTIDVDRRNFENFPRDAGVEWLEDVTEGVIRSWLLGHRHVSGAILATYDRSLRVTLNRVENRDYVAESPMERHPRRRTPRTLVDTFSRGDVQAIIRRATEGRHPRRDVALEMLLIGYGVADRGASSTPSINVSTFGTPMGSIRAAQARNLPLVRLQLVEYRR